MTTIFNCEKNNVLIRFVKIYGVWTEELKKLTSDDIEIFYSNNNNHEIFTFFLKDQRNFSKVFFYNLGLFLKHRELERMIAKERRGKEEAIRAASIEVEKKMEDIKLTKEELRERRLEALRKKDSK